MHNTKWTRRSFLKAASAAAAGLSFSTLGCAMPHKTAGKAKPNVILVITDDQGYGDLACHGNRIIRTDALDKLHSESVRLTDYHVCPTCSPTRSALMTGRNNNRVGVWHTIYGRSQLRKDEVTMADVFAASGYKTGIFGKWHLGDNYPFRPQDRGFDEVLIHGGGGVGQTPDYWNNDYYDDTYFHNGKAVKRKGYCTDVWFEGATRFIDANKNKPFFAYITTNSPHWPYLVHPKYTAMYEGKENVANPRFYGMLTNVDENIAKLRKHLGDIGIADNTVFIFTTDNGTAGGYNKNTGVGYNSGMRGTKGSEYDGGHRVPMFIHYPDGGLDKPKDIDRITAHMDILPTLIDLCGLTEPQKVAYDGRSLMPLIKGTGMDWPKRVIITDSQRVEDPVKWRKSVVMTDQWRLVNGTELYDIKADPSQETDIAEQRPDVTKRLIAEYDKWWASVSERFGEYTRTIIGTEYENPTVITCMDWHSMSPWHQGMIRAGRAMNGLWKIDVAKTGKYRFELRRYPVESNLAITAAAPIGDMIPDGKPLYNSAKALPITSARLKIADFDKSKTVKENDKAVAFEVNLEKGRTEFQTWFSGEKIKNPVGAYYVYVEYLG